MEWNAKALSCLEDEAKALLPLPNACFLSTTEGLWTWTHVLPHLQDLTLHWHLLTSEFSLLHILHRHCFLLGCPAWSSCVLAVNLGPACGTGPRGTHSMKAVGDRVSRVPNPWKEAPFHRQGLYKCRAHPDPLSAKVPGKKCHRVRAPGSLEGFSSRELYQRAFPGYPDPTPTWSRDCRCAQVVRGWHPLTGELSAFPFIQMNLFAWQRLLGKTGLELCTRPSMLWGDSSPFLSPGPCCNHWSGHFCPGMPSPLSHEGSPWTLPHVK